MVTHRLLIAFALLGLTHAKVTRIVSEGALNDAIEAPGDVMVMFYAPWCGHCKELQPKYEEASDIIEEKGINVQFLKMDAEIHKEVAEKFGINGFPNLRYFKQGETQVLDGPDDERTTENLVEWVTKVNQAPDRIVHLSTMDMFHSFLDPVKSNGVYVVGYFEDEAHAELFINVAKDFKFPVRFAWSSLVEAGKELGFESTPNSVTLFKPFDERKVSMTLLNPLEGTSTSKNEMAKVMHQMIGVPLEEAMKLVPESKDAKSLRDWVRTMMYPLVVPMTEDYMDLIFRGPIQLHLITVFNPQDEDGFKAVEQVVQEVALANRGQVLHIMLPAIDETLEMRKFLQVDGRTLPTAVLSDMREVSEEEPRGQQIVLPRKDAFTVDNLNKFEAKGMSVNKKNTPKKTAKKTAAAAAKTADATEDATTSEEL